MDKSKSVTAKVDVTEFLLCSGCRQIPIAVEELLQCVNGHLICDDCFPETEICSECQVAVRKDVKIKCAALTKTLIAEIPAACPFFKDGCTEGDMPRADLKAHLEKCPFKNEKDGNDSGSGVEGSKALKEETRMENGVVFALLGIGSPRRGKVDKNQEDFQPPAKRPRTSNGRAKDKVEEVASTSAEPSDLPQKGNIFTGGIGDHIFPKCNECHKTFVNEAVLVKHQNRCHAQELEFFRCGFCGKNLRAKTSVAHHIAAMHHEGTNENAGEKGFFCPFCAAKFGKKETLGKHIIQSHMNAIA